MAKYIATFVIDVADDDDLGQVMGIIENVPSLGDFRSGVEVIEVSLDPE